MYFNALFLTFWHNNANLMTLHRNQISITQW